MSAYELAQLNIALMKEPLQSLEQVLQTAAAERHDLARVQKPVPGDMLKDQTIARREL